MATITANSGYNFGTGYALTVTMGGADITSEVAIVSTDTISINIPSVTGDIYINCVAVEIPPKLATPTVAMNADGKTLEITDVENATSYDVYVDGTLKTNVQRVTGYTVTFGGTSVSTSEIGNVTVTIPNDGTFQLTNSTVVKNNVSLFTLGGTTANDMRVVVEMGGTSTQYEVFENIDINVTGNATVYLKNKYE